MNTHNEFFPGEIRIILIMFGLCFHFIRTKNRFKCLSSGVLHQEEDIALEKGWGYHFDVPYFSMKTNL